MAREPYRRAIGARSILCSMVRYAWYGGRMQDEEADFVLVPVPKDRVLDVMAFLTQERGDHAEVDETRSEPEQEPEVWDAESLRGLVMDAWPKQVHVLERIAQGAPDWVTAEDLRAVLRPHLEPGKKDGRALGAVMRALGQRSKRFNGRLRPFDEQWTDQHGNRYKMGAEHAATVLEAVAEYRKLYLSD